MNERVNASVKLYNRIAVRVAEFFGLPIEAVFSRYPFRPMSEELYGDRPAPRRVPRPDRL